MKPFRTLVVVLSLACSIGAEELPWQKLDFAPTPIDNPLKGLVPYAGDVRTRFPHSMEFNYLFLSKLVVGYDNYDWRPLEKLLDEVASRGHQTTFRVAMEYPGKNNTIPQFLIDDGLKVHRYLNTNTAPFPPSKVETPDYSDPKLRKVLRAFVAALGKKYDGDPRIACITAGLLGTWGEWHTHPRHELFASKEVQKEVLDAYEKAFKVTPILLRYPAGKDHYAQAPNAHRKFGYHDDSFAWATLDTRKKGDEWFFLTAMRTAGPSAMDKWKTQPIGGEIRPEAWGKIFDDEPNVKGIQNFRECVEKTHATWLMDSGMFAKQQSPARIARAKVQVRRLGYDFYATASAIERLGDGAVRVYVNVDNRGVAPFYFDWPIYFGLLDAEGNVLRNVRSTEKLTGLLPGDPVRVWTQRVELGDVPKGEYFLGVHVPNPMPKGHPVRFANTTQDQHAKGWLTVGKVMLK